MFFVLWVARASFPAPPAVVLEYRSPGICTLVTNASLCGAVSNVHTHMRKVEEKHEDTCGKSLVASFID